MISEPLIRWWDQGPRYLQGMISTSSIVPFVMVTKSCIRRTFESTIITVARVLKRSQTYADAISSVVIHFMPSMCWRADRAVLRMGIEEVLHSLRALAGSIGKGHLRRQEVGRLTGLALGCWEGIRSSLRSRQPDS